MARAAVRSRCCAVLAAFALALALLVPVAGSAPPHIDESQYIWSASYFAQRVLQLDLFSHGTDELYDPGWTPQSYWALTQPMGTRLLYGLVIQLTGSPTPAVPFVDLGPDVPPVESPIPPETLRIARVTAVVTAAVAFAVFALRFGWLGAATTASLLIPHVRGDLAHAWAEAPLLLGFSLAAATWRTRWFPYVCGLAATFKLTAVVLWPLVFFKHQVRANRFARTRALLPTVLLWSALTPPSWQFGGPLYVCAMIVNRLREQVYLSAHFGGPLGLFLPSRYVLPLELALVAGALWFLSRLSLVRHAELTVRGFAVRS